MSELINRKVCLSKVLREVFVISLKLHGIHLVPPTTFLIKTVTRRNLGKVEGRRREKTPFVRWTSPTGQNQCGRDDYNCKNYHRPINTSTTTKNLFRYETISNTDTVVTECGPERSWGRSYRLWKRRTGSLCQCSEVFLDPECSSR